MNKYKEVFLQVLCYNINIVLGVVKLGVDWKEISNYPPNDLFAIYKTYISETRYLFLSTCNLATSSQNPINLHAISPSTKTLIYIFHRFFLASCMLNFHMAYHVYYYSSSLSNKLYDFFIIISNLLTHTQLISYRMSSLFFVQPSS